MEQQPLPPQVPLLQAPLQARRKLSLQVLPRQQQGTPPAAASLAVAAGAPTLGLDRPQGEQSARSAACPRRAS
ncbi:MAG TPA: hypothetical protein VGN34_32045 [Ktedonobacteraceae bacterium]